MIYLIILGESIKDKEIRLDINVMLNNQSIINLEMQVANQFNWPNRSLLYLNRSFDNLNRGGYYLDIQPAVHIGFLDYTLFPDYPEFYATYKMINVKNHHIYSDNFVLSVVDLSRIDLATDVQIRKMCRDRIEYHQDIHNYQRFTAQQKQIILEKDNTIAENDAALAEKNNIIANLRAQLGNSTDEKPKS